MRGGVNGLMLDSAPPTAGKLRRASRPSGREGIWPADVSGDYLVYFTGFVERRQPALTMSAKTI